MIRNSGLVVISLVIGFLMLEGALRVFVDVPSPYPYSSPLLVSDRRGFWILDPGAEITMGNNVDFNAKQVRINANATRHVGCRPTALEDPNRSRVLIVGDSQTFGHGLSDDESWPNRLQCLLAKSGDKSLIINGGIPATNADQYLARFSHYITMLHSGDRVLIVLTWNDLTVDYRSYDSTRYSLRPCPDANQSRSYSASVNCVRHPKNYYQQKVTWRRWLYEKTGFFVPAFSSIRGFLETAKFSSAAAFVALPKLKLLYYRLRKQKPLTGELSPENFTAVIRFAARIRDLAAPHGIDAAVILLPNRLFYDDQYYQAYSKAGAVFPERDYPSFATRDACRDNGLTCLSLFEALRTDKPDRYNFAFDGHLNPAGAEAVAQQVARWLIDGPLKHQP